MNTAAVSAAHMAQQRYAKHQAALQWRRQWQALARLGFGWHQDAKAARQQMRNCIASARFYRKGQRHQAALATTPFCETATGVELVCQGLAYGSGEWLSWHPISAMVYENRMRWPRDGYQVRIAALSA